MARIRRVQPDAPLELLLPHQTVGRGAGCRLRDDDRHVSSSHAEIRWDGSRWVIQDLGSRNGTWVGGRRIGAGRTMALSKGAIIALGRPDNRWELVDDDGPDAVAVAPDGRMLEALDGVLALPDDDEPLATVYRDHQGRWVLDDETGSRRIQTGSTIHLDVTAWTLFLPDVHIQTITRLDQAPTPSNVRLLLLLSGDDQLRDVQILHEQRAFPVRSRASSALLLHLAQQRVADAADPSIEDDEHGWRDQADLQERLDLRGNSFNVAVHRLRAAFARSGLTEAAGVIERRQRPNQVRIGVRDILIETA